jgi:hypothetical protein
MNPWEPQQKESMPAYAAFAEYRDLGPERSIEAVSRKVSKSLPLLKRWSSRWSWVERAKAYDAHLDEIRRTAREQSIAKQARKIMSADEVRAELTEIAEAPWREFIEVKMADGEVLTAQLKLGDKLKSLELMGKNHKLFTDKVDHSVVFGEALDKLQAEFPDLTKDELKTWFAEIVGVQQIGGVQ